MNNTPSPKPYAVLYHAGTHGTWLTWFISEHKNFNKCKLHMNDSTYKEYGISPQGWWHQTQDFSDLVKSYRTSDKSKIAFKVMPCHDLVDDNEISDWVRIDFFNKSKCEHVIYPIIYDTMLDQFNARWKKIIEYHHPDKKFISFDFSKENPGRELHDIVKSKADICYIDIGKILTKDRNEYQKLLEFIDEQPMHNWETYIDNVINDFYKFEEKNENT